MAQKPMHQKPMTRQELEDRLIDFAVLIIEISESLHNTKAGNHLSGQIARSGTSPALNYGEAQDAESTKDFLHKLKIVLKELRETLVCLKIIRKAKLCDSSTIVETALAECNELVSIFVSSVNSTKKRLAGEENSGA